MTGRGEIDYWLLVGCWLVVVRMREAKGNDDKEDEDEWEGEGGGDGGANMASISIPFWLPRYRFLHRYSFAPPYKAVWKI